MGEAYSAIAFDATSVWWNAAALADLQSAQFTFNHRSHFQSISLDYLGMATRWGEGGIGFGVLSFSSGELEYRESATEEPIGNFSILALHPVISYGRRIDPELSFGLSLIGLYEKVHTDEATGFAMSGGALYDPQILDGLTVAAVFQNFGPKFGLKEITYPLPFQAKLGVGYCFGMGQFGVTLATDWVSPSYDDYRVNTGIEVNYKSLVSFRGGYKWGYDTQRMTAGLGVAYSGVAIDYAYVPYRELGGSHRISLLLTP